MKLNMEVLRIHHGKENQRPKRKGRSGEEKRRGDYIVCNRWVNVVKNSIISNCPNTPCHQDDNLHEERYTQLPSHSIEDL